MTKATSGGVVINQNWWFSGSDQYLFSRQPLRSPGDFEDLKTRSHSSPLSDWLRGMGALPQFVPFAEVYGALERGALDAAVTGATSGYGQRWYEVADYMNGPLFGSLSTGNLLNSDVWDRMPTDLRAIFVEEGAKSELEALRLASVQNLMSLRNNTDAGMAVVELAPEVKKRSFDVALIQYVIPSWLERLRRSDEYNDAMAMFNESVGPYVGLRIASDGTVVKDQITKGPHAGNITERAGVSGACAGDRGALVKLYHATDGDNWTQKFGWLSDRPVDAWFGVNDDSEGCVTRLHLPDNGLSGPIPMSISNLSQLKYLSLSRNQLTGTIPPELGRLSKLKNLYLSENQLSGPIPPELGNLSNLEELRLYDNQLSGPIPPELGNLPNLEKLYLYNNQLSGPLPVELGNLSKLEELSLSNNRLSGAIPPELGNLSSLKLLYLDNNQLSAYPNNPAALKAIRAQAKCRKAM